MASSLESQAPSSYWNSTSAPTSAEYQSIISCRRVVLRLTWWNFGWMTGVSVDIGGDPRVGDGQLGAQVVDERREVVEAFDGAEDVGVGPHDDRLDAVLVEPGGQAAVEILELLERDDVGADGLEEPLCVAGSGRRAAG